MTIESTIKDILKEGTEAEEITSEVTAEEVVAEEEAPAADISVDVSEDVSALVDGEELSEEFKQKAATIFEAAVVSRVKQEIAKLEEAFAAKVDEAVEAKIEGIVEKVDGYLDYCVEQWMNDNELALESGIRADITENFINGLKNLFIESYIEVPEEKRDLIGEMETEIAALKEKLSEAIDTSVESKKQIDALNREMIFSQVSEGLTDTDVEKFKGLAEELAYESSEVFTEKLKTIRESYFKPSKSKVDAVVSGDAIVEGEEKQKTIISESVQGYANFLNRV